MKIRPTLAGTTHVLMILTLFIALYKLFMQHQNRPHTYKTGDHLTGVLPQQRGANDRFIVLVDRADCIYCRASMPFYERLTMTASGAGLGVIDATPDPVSDHRDYLEANHVHIDHVLPLKDTSLKISGTPTLIILDKSSTVLGAWVGKLSSAEETNVMNVALSGHQ